MLRAIILSISVCFRVAKLINNSHITTICHTEMLRWNVTNAFDSDYRKRQEAERSSVLAALCRQ